MSLGKSIAESRGEALGLGGRGASKRQGRAAGGRLEGCWGDAGDTAAQAAENGERQGWDAGGMLGMQQHRLQKMGSVGRASRRRAVAVR